MRRWGRSVGDDRLVHEELLDVRHEHLGELVVGLAVDVRLPAGLVVVDSNLRVRSMNVLMRDMLGIPDGRLDDNPPLDALLPSAALAEGVRHTLASGAPRDVVGVTVDGHADGARHFEFNIRRTSQQDGHLLLLIGYDVTSQHQARLRLQESEEFFRLTFH